MINLFFVFLFLIFNIHAQEEKEIVVVILSYNNKQWCEQNLSSALAQEYSNFKIIYIDDCSTDGTSELVQSFIKLHDHQQKIHYIRNDTRRGALANHWMAIHHYCPDDCIVVHLDGDDFFMHQYVLRRINQEYQDPNVWLTYGSYCEYPSGKIGWAYEIPQDIVTQNKWRDINDIRWGPTHLRTFYAWLFKEIKLEDLFFEGTFFPVAGDVAFMYPLAEMAGQRSKFIPDILYAYNVANPLNDFNTKLHQQLSLLQFIRTQKQKYQPLKEKPLKETPAQADLVIFSFDRPLQLYALLESIEKYIKGISKITVLYRTSDQEFTESYILLAQRFPNVIFDKQTENPYQDFKPKLLDIVFNSPNPYILFAVDDIIVKDDVNIQACIAALEKTHAYGFFLRMGKNLTSCYMLWNGWQPLPKLTQIYSDVYAWQFCQGKGDWWYPNTLDMTLYRKKDLEHDFHSYEYTSPNTLEGVLFTNPDMSKIGLCYSESKIINIPLNQVQQDWKWRNMHCPKEILLKIFQQGGKIDIQSFYKIQNTAVHMEYIPTIIPR